MAEESRNFRKPEKPTIAIPNRTESIINAMSRSSSVPSSPNGGLTKARSLKANCLCSPTTHAGSFRCRYHRNSGLTRNSMSVGAKLSELGAHMPVAPKIADRHDPLHGVAEDRLLIIGARVPADHE